MKFGPVPIDQAVGAILAHSVALPDGRLRKGKVIEAADLGPLEAAGLSEIIVARLDPGDVGENDAAAQLACALAPEADAAGLRIGKAATGRANLFSTVIGVAEIDAAAINAVNAVNPMITVATVPRWQRMGPGGMVATVKIIAYAVPRNDLDRACAVGRGAMRMRPTAYGSAALIQTSVDDDDGDKGHRALHKRLEALAVPLAPKKVVPHRIEPLAQALTASDAEVLFILTGSATSDLNDVAPQAVRAAGGTVTHFGMPVDPGNLLFFGTLGDRPVIGLPGCARSPALNGADWVLERLICGVTVTPADIAAMGVGGLLKEIPQRGRLREA
ncbi:molybdopterin-binding protein [Thalassococcus sp. CAU 1522]|uniref:Molybdopterin-binding protein n=1 Tax=Thalassococcus arenae TaxID=2851652 RepID=A0ABS6N9G1_9RHOB|nr:molybdopterin-binding protein [Thalassococcus arenae]MBV2360650.1 molybdopterin-binding protein [Thalassococcus arenae]